MITVSICAVGLAFVIGYALGRSSESMSWRLRADRPTPHFSGGRFYFILTEPKYLAFFRTKVME